MTTKTNYTFAIPNSDGTSSTTYVDMDDMFVSAETFYEKGLYGWGDNANGDIGDGTLTSRSSPVQVGTLTDWKQVEVGRHALATKLDNSLWAWGGNTVGQLGDGTTVTKSSPVRIGTLNDWEYVSAGEERHSLAVKTDGTLWAWGDNSNGQLGDGTVVNKSSPIKIGTLNDWKYVSAGSKYSTAIKTDGTIWAWGRNDTGILGDGTVVGKSSPIKIGILTNWKYVSAGSVYSGSAHTLAIKTDGTLWAWGDGNFGKLGDGTIVSKSSPIQIGLLTNWKQVVAGYEHSAAVKTDGTLWTWGNNQVGQLGDGTVVNKSSPIQIGLLTNWKQVAVGGDDKSRAFTVGLKTDGTLWAWGNNDNGRLGDGTLIGKSSPVQIGILTNWKILSAGFETTSAILSGDY